MLAGIICRCLGRINSASAAYSNNNLNVVFLDNLHHLLDLAVTGDTAKYLIASVIIQFAEAGFNLVMARLESAVGAYEEPSLTHISHLFMELIESVPSLNIFQRFTHCTKPSHHNKCTS